MAPHHPCYRHSARGVWIAVCPDCTAWHRAALPNRERRTDRPDAEEQPPRVEEPVGAGDRG
jgi:hypothetical protein